MKKISIKFIKNLFFNFLGYGMNAIILQLFIIPNLSRKLNIESYGVFQTTLSIFQFIPATISLSLNNFRLILNNKVEYENFSLLNILGIILGLICSCVLLILTKCKLNFWELILFLMINYLWMNSEYFIVEFRQKMEYEKIFFYNFLQGVGYIIGTYISFFIEIPLIIYFCGMLFGYIYTIKTTIISKEKIKKNKYYKKVKKEYIVLLFNNMIANILGICDRLMIMPMLGADLVGVYTSSLIFTKLVSLVISPVTGIILSYISTQRRKDNKSFYKLLLVLLILGIIGFILLFETREFILDLLYPIYAKEAIKYTKITISIAMIQMITGIIGPFVLKYCSLRYQGIYNIFSLGIYFIFVIFLIKKIEVKAIYYGTLISAIIKLFLYIFLYVTSDFKGGKVNEV